MFTSDNIMAMEYDRNTVDEAIDTAVGKFLHIADGQMYSRMPLEILDNIFMGDFAKNCLRRNIAEAFRGPVLDYDRIRLDGYEQHDPGWDLCLTKHLIRGEVKSSFRPVDRRTNELYDLQRIVDTLDFKMTAWKKNDPEDKKKYRPERVADLIFQVYFPGKELDPKAAEFFKTKSQLDDNLRTRIDVINVFSKLINLARYKQPLFFGFNTKASLERSIALHGAEQCTWTFNGCDRVYWSSKLKDGFSFPEFVSYLDKMEALPYFSAMSSVGNL